MKISVWFVFFLQLFNVTQQQLCVMKGSNKDGVPFIYNGPPINVDSDKILALKGICPHLINDHVKNTKVCCDRDQLTTLVAQLSAIESIFQSCPQCQFSIKSVFCNLACSPMQSSFLDVIADKQKKLVLGSIYHVSQEYMDGIFNSCKYNKNPQTGEKVIDSFGCRNNCTGRILIQKFFQLSPYPVTLTEYEGTSKYSEVEKFYPCSDPVRINKVDYPRCSSTHCKTNCFQNVTFEDPPEKLILNFLNAYDIAILCVWGVVIKSIAIYIFVCFIIKKRRNSQSYLRNSITVSEEENENSAFIEKKSRLSCVLRGMKTVIDQLCRLTIKFRYFSMTFFLMIAIGNSLVLIFKMKLTSNPMDLWVPDKTIITENYKNFNQDFGGFFRIEQIIITSKAKSENYSDYTGKAFNKELFIFTAKLLENIKMITATYTYNGTKIKVMLDDICYKPTTPEYDSCVVTSPIEYFQGSSKIFIDTGEDWMKHVSNCIDNPTNINDALRSNFSLTCLSTFLAPIDPKLIFGGYTENQIQQADTIVMTITVVNHENREDQTPAAEWEREFIKFMMNLKHSNEFEISFSSEISTEDELYRGSFKDVKIAAVSYMLMFLYVCFGMGKFSVNAKDMLVDLKISTAIGGIFIIFLSVSTTLGILVLAGYKINLIVIEVLPFLLLAIGADNFFLLDHYFMSTLMKSYEKGDLCLKSVTQKAIKKAGVGICLSALVNTSTFFIGMVNDMPVVKLFSLASAIAMIIMIIFQITIFIPLMYCDNLRMLSNRVTFLFIKVKENIDHPVGDPERYREGLIRKYVRKVHQHIVTYQYLAYIIVTIFFFLWGAMLICATKLQVGLDQKIALPKDSYLQNYFNSVFDKLKVGAPYFIVIPRGVDYSKQEVQNKICSLSYCNTKSLGNLISYASENSTQTQIATATNNWIDTYLQWLQSGTLPTCCMVVKKKLDRSGRVMEEPSEFIFCTRDMYESKLYVCEPCLPESRFSKRPNEEEFNLFLPSFLDDIPSTDGCILGGKPAFKTSVILDPEYYSVPRTSNISVITSRFMGYHTQLVTSSSFIDALRKALKIESMLQEILENKAYLYSIFYVYYQGYMNLNQQAITIYGLMCLGITLFTFIIFFFKLRISIIYSITVIMTNISVLFMMYIFKVNLNPVSLVNIIMMFAISIEFTIHTAVAYMNSKQLYPVQRAKDALIHAGASVFSGIAITKIIGVSVLAFASSEIFIEYYFKMYCFVIVSGILHGLIFLPACLSIFGPMGDKDTEHVSILLS